MNENNDPETKTNSVGDIHRCVESFIWKHPFHPAAAGFVYRRSNIEFVNENIVNNPEVYRTQWTFEVEASLTVTINQEPYEQLFCVLDFQTLV